ncbi:MAG TPA: circularly permuted type 2 ATP-grasp protein, partial [Anaeromyxobacteraceae bacterium]|nr:circularly permuted type 2 ATP-grasp protein [Anaeromyxobacteraceae bacterium]
MDSKSRLLADYAGLPGTWDELFTEGGAPRPAFRRAIDALDAHDPASFAVCQGLAERALLNQGVTFSVYSDDRGTEKIFPFCLVPRMISAPDWAALEKGLVQRVRALELFLADLYGPQRILKDRVIPGDLVLASKSWFPQLHGVRPPGDVRIHIAGIDLVRDPKGTWRVLEDNLRTPSGVSYVLENRIISKRVIPEVLDAARVEPVDAYPGRLADSLRSVSPVGPDETSAVVLTPGPYNSAYFEHSFLARTMGLELVQAADLFTEGDRVFCRTTRGPRPVHVIYRRIDETFLDPEVFRPDSLLGVPGILRAWAKGNVALANAPGNGVADDKAVYPFVPDIVRYYLSEEPLLAQLDTWVCARDEDRRFVLDHLGELVVKAVDEAGGYGMLMGPQATKAQIEEFRKRVAAEPRKYIAQHRVELSSCPTWCSDASVVEPRRVDLRPYILTSRTGPWVLPGGLTR